MAKEEFTRDYFDKRKKGLYYEIQGYIVKVMPLLSGNILANIDFLDDFVAAVNELIRFFETGFGVGYVSERDYEIVKQSLSNMKENLILLRKNYDINDYTDNRVKRERIKGFANDSIRYFNGLQKYL